MRAILAGGLIAGALDLADAFVFFGLRGARPIGILHSIARGVLGAKAATLGWRSAALGFLLQFMIALTAAAVYYAASRKLTVLRTRAVVCGLLYGIVVYLVMNRLVLPAVGIKPAFAPVPFINAILAHTFLVGLPISLAVRRYS